MIIESPTPDKMPKGWSIAKLAEFTEVILGQSPPSSTYNEEGIGLPFYQGKLEFGKIYPVPSKWCSAPKKVALKGDVLISVRAPVGPTNINPDRSCIGRGLAAIRGLSGIEPLFLIYLIRAHENIIIGKGTGTTFNAISGDQLRDLLLPLPPLNEQKRIVNKLEELFTKLDSSVESLKKVQVQLKQYRQSILRHAFKGKLTEKWREIQKGKIESALTLLDRIKKERARKGDKKFKDLKSEDKSNTPKIPDGWTWAELYDVISVKSGEGLTSSRMAPEGKYPVYGGNGIVGYHDQYMYNERKLIIGRVGAKCGVVHITLPNNWITDNALIVDFWLMNMKFLYYFLTFLNLNQFSVSTAQQVISAAKIYPLLIKIPPLAEQNMITDEIDKRFSIVDNTENIIKKNLQQAEIFRHSILKKAFEGELVPQDPNDEPAEILLERIRQDRLKEVRSPTFHEKEKEPTQMELTKFGK